jgi:hypothetical protein
VKVAAKPGAATPLRNAASSATIDHRDIGQNEIRMAAITPFSERLPTT